MSLDRAAPAPASCSTTQTLLHWALVAAQYLLLDRRGRAFHALMRDEPGACTTVTVLHMICGRLVLGAMLWRTGSCGGTSCSGG
ncbi:hypothetical protein [uncultured Salipiger sp.]|uniref:hypothetical protein n=1 Tax=uncultured Salipiger sp. TaxID=499810 RepID=UPI002599AF0C|nr:hypothetical protein [uncultured Salipiger sp.]